MDTIKPLPFSVDRDRPVPLTSQIANGVTRAIHSGYYAAGERLPNLDEFASSLQVGRQTAQNAVRELVSQGQLVARRKAGIRVPAGRARVFTHQVAHLRCGGSSYYFSSLHDRLAASLARRRIQVHAIEITREECAAGMPSVHATLSGNAIDLALIDGHPDVLVDLCLGHGVRSILSEDGGSHPRAHSPLHLDEDTSLGEMAAVARQRGVQTVGVLGQDCDRVLALLRRAGLTAHSLSPGLPVSSPHPEVIERAGLEAMTAVLAAESERPDLVYFADDYMARGGLTAIAWSGLRIPQDLRLVVRTNHAHAPVLPISLARIEIDPFAIAEALADVVTGNLQSGGHAVPVTVISSTFKPGDTL